MLEKLGDNFLLRNMRKIAPYAKPYLGRIILFLSLVIPLGSSDVLITWGLKQLIDGLQGVKHIEASTLPFAVYLMPVVVIAFASIQGILEYFTEYLNAWIGNRIANDAKIDMFRKLISLDPVYFDNLNSGDVLLRYYNDPESACRDLLSQCKDLLGRLVTVCSLVCYLVFLSWRLAVVGVVMLGLIMLPVVRLRKKIKQLVSGVVNISSKIITSYNETFGGIKTILAYNLQNSQIKRLKKNLGEFFNLQMKMMKRIAWLRPSMHIISAVGIGVTIGYGTFLVLIEVITIGTLVSFATALFLIYNPLRSLGTGFSSMQHAMFAVERIFSLLEIDPAIKDSDQKILAPTEFKSLEFDQVYFSYTKDRPILKGISFKVNCGETVALVGNSGGGKTTITNLLMRLYDVRQGTIKINGEDIRNFSLHDLRSLVAVVFQDNFLFDGSVADNLLIGKANASEEEMWIGLEQACLSEFVKQLPQGLNTKIGEHGVLLSGGQKQRLAVARAFLKNAPIIVLDEATSALDSQSEAVIQEAIRNLVHQKTVLVIAHRLSTILHADQILVIQGGEIVEHGNHQTLIDKRGVYHGLYDIQFHK